jgi:protein O-GlcNAc transferase
MPPTTVTLQHAFDIAMRLHREGRLQDASRIYNQILAQDPNEPDALQLSGLIAHDEGRHAEAVALIRRAIAINPMIAAFYNNLGIALRGTQQADDAIAAYRHAIRLEPFYADAHYNLGNALHSNGSTDEAIASYRKALELKPDSVNVYTNLAKIFHEQGLWDEVIIANEQILGLDPQSADASNNLGFAFALQGRLDDAIAAYRRAVDLRPDVPEYHSRLIQTLRYHPGYDGPAVLAECRRWNTRHADPLKQCILRHSNDPTIGRRLRIGYVSADFRNHACAVYSERLITFHNREQVEVICYAEVSEPDAVTERFRSYALKWHTTVGMADESLAALIRSDKIDILVDLNLHTSHNRLLTFARKPAPIQVSWLGFPGTTGLDAIDYRFTDPHLDPPGSHDAMYSERSIRLNDTFWCYSSRDADLPLNASPALKQGYVTFGSMNSFCKVTDVTLDLWAAVLRANPASGMLILADPGSHRDRTLNRLQQRGVSSDRIRFEARRPRREYMMLYGEIDIALDTFPYNGETTSLDGLWMGVPLITMAGQTAVSRAGLSFLSNLGLTEWVARDLEHFAAISVELAHDLPKLAQHRQMLRSRMQASPVMDAARFVRSVEEAYRAMWQEWCERQ